MLKKTYISYLILLLFGVLSIMSCQSDERTSQGGDASLRFVIRSADTSISTRGVEDLDDDGSVSDDEVVVDGRRMYRLALFLLDGSRVASSAVLEADDPRFVADNTEAVVNFDKLDYSKTYKMYAVANYGNYGALAGNLAEVNQDNLTSGLKVTASSDNLCNSAVAYPLTLIKDISLMPGDNVVSGELVRTFARVRINVRNQSSMNDLYITNLSFASKFTQKTADLFSEGGAADVSPVVTSDGAITPFEANVMIPRITSSGGVSEKNIFDTYLLESTGGDYKYTLSLKYQGDEIEEVYTVAGAGITNANNIEDGAMYVIRNTNGTYLYDNGDKVGAGSSYLINNELNHNYVWRFNMTANNKYTIESMGGSGRFMQSSKVDGSKIPLTTNAGNNDYFTVSTSSNYIRFQATNGRYYLSVNSTTACGHNSNSNQQRRNFHLYKVTKEGGVSSVLHEETLPIRIIDKNTGEASPLAAIRRNDFIEILVNVTYNEKTGDVDFQVSEWNRVDGEVVFD